MDTPTYNAEGEQVYKPQPGEYWRAGLQFRESYGGVVASINDIIVDRGGTAGSYPSNFAGIISAIGDLGKYIASEANVSMSPTPSGWDVEANAWATAPEDGTLWFDSRQGRLMVAFEGNFWQANGGDGLAQVKDTQPTNPPVIGSTWFDTANSIFYVYVGEDLWEAVTGTGSVSVTTASLPLSMPLSTFTAASPNIISAVDTTQMVSQEDFNKYIYAASLELDQSVAEGAVTVSAAAPTANLVDGSLWFDETNEELNVYRIDGVNAEWKSVSSQFALGTALASVSSALASEVQTRTDSFTTLDNEVASQNTVNADLFTDIDNELSALETKVTALETATVDLSGYSLTTEIDALLAPITNDITDLQNATIDFSPYARVSDVDAEIDNLENKIASRPTIDYVESLIPNVSNYVTNAGVALAIAAADSNHCYLSGTGGTITGSLVLNKQNVGIAALDFSTAASDSQQAFKFVANDGVGNYPCTTIGTNDNFWEFAHSFGSNEDFCWVHNNNKVVSINKDGLACNQILLADFQPNTTEGRVISNPINIRTKLTEYDTELSTIRSDIATLNSAVGVTTNRIFYGDNQPTVTVSDGDLWFDSRNLRMNVQHGGYWIFPDRVEDLSLKSALFNAVNTSADFETLKIKLLAVLI
tara:strand:- start:346 stop:2283 length:1938 start_codon:yes stop_codon:yes gene_type:complete